MARASTVVAGAAALVGPLLLAALQAFAVARPSTGGDGDPSSGSPSSSAPPDVRLVARRRFGLGAGALVTHALLFLYLATLHASPLPRPAALAGELPAAAPPAGVAVYQLPTGLITGRRPSPTAAARPRTPRLLHGGRAGDPPARRPPHRRRPRPRRRRPVADMPLAFARATRITRGDPPPSSSTPPATIAPGCAPSSSPTPTGITSSGAADLPGSR
jgi:hypothetical protein